MSIVQKIIAELRKAVQGKDQVLIWILMTILANGNVLLEDIPGVGKTTIAVAFSRALGLDYGRVQFNPDVLPSDITGYSVYDKQSGKMIYQKGAILCNLFLADELNRATSRTQSALLEAMEEGQVTVDGVTHPLPRPFTVIATQNPTGAAGTQLLPDSQMDRFTVRLSIGYPKAKDERDMVLARQGGVNPLDTVERVVTKEELIAMQDTVAAVYVKDTVVNYAVSLVAQTRNHPQIQRGASPRATLAVVAMAKAAAFLNGRDYVIPDDVQTVFAGTVAHRLLMSADAQAQGTKPEQVLGTLLNATPAPGV
jgi:MoxR-like ATPase